MKRFGILLFSLALPVMVFAGGNQAAASGELRFAWWGNTVRDQRTWELIDLFQQRNPGVSIEGETLANAGYWERMMALAATGGLPDVMQHDVSYIGGFAANNLLEDLTPFSGRNRPIDLSNWDEAGLSAGRLNGQLLGLVLGTNAFAMVVDPAVLERAGVTIDDTTWTWADYEQIARQVFERTGVQTMPLIIDVRPMIEHISRQFGAPLITADGRQMGVGTNQQAVAALRNVLEIQQRLVQAGVMWNPEDGAIDSRGIPEFPFPQGRTWNDDIWSNQYVAFAAAANRPIRLLMYPSVTGRAPFGTYLRASMYISMTRSSGNKDLGAQFINFFANDIDANRILLAERGVPVPTHVRTDLLGRVDEGNRVIFEYITRIGPWASPADQPPNTDRIREVENALKATMLQLLTNRITLDAAMTQIIQGSNTILQR